jgi:hypothetical protein
MFGIRALLCDHCHHRFKAFSLRAPKTCSPRHSHRKDDVFIQAPTVNLNRLNGAVVEEHQAEALVQSSEPRRLTIDLAALRLQSKTQEEVVGAIVVDQISPVRCDLRTEITKLYAQGAKDQSRQNGSAQAHLSSSDLPACANCGSRNVKRRRRTLKERLALSGPAHKVFTCRSCGESFYAETGGDGREHGPLGATGVAR